MAVILCLSPLPAAGTVGQSKALDYIKAQCAGRMVPEPFPTDPAATKAMSDTVALALAELAAARVEREASGAPQAVKNEACIRYIGYLAQADYGAIRSETTGPKSVEYVVNHQRAWINCGARSILAPWRVLHAAPITHASGAG